MHCMRQFTAEVSVDRFQFMISQFREEPPAQFKGTVIFRVEGDADVMKFMFEEAYVEPCVVGNDGA